MLKKSNLKMSDFLKTLSNGKEVLDFHKIAKANFPMHLIITERGAKGKTLNSKLYAQDIYEATKQPTIWLQNTLAQITKAKSEFLEDISKPFVKQEIGSEANAFWNNCRTIGNVASNQARVEHHNNQFIKLLPLAHAELMKGSRLNWSTLIYDEFNVSFESVVDGLNKWDSLLHSMEDLVANNGQKQQLKVFIFGNNKSLNNPIIYRLGVTHILDEVTEVYTDDGFPLMLIISPQFTSEQAEVIDKTNSNNFIYQMSKQLGTYKHSYLNESQSDQLSNVRLLAYSKNFNLIAKPQFTIVHRKQYLNVYKLIENGKSTFHIVEVDKKSAFKVFAFTRRDIQEDAEYNLSFKSTLAKYLSANIVSFENIVSRELFISSLIK